MTPEWPLSKCSRVSLASQTLIWAFDSVSSPEYILLSWNLPKSLSPIMVMIIRRYICHNTNTELSSCYLPTHPGFDSVVVFVLVPICAKKNVDHDYEVDEDRQHNGNGAYKR